MKNIRTSRDLSLTPKRNKTRKCSPKADPISSTHSNTEAKVWRFADDAFSQLAGIPPQIWNFPYPVSEKQKKNAGLDNETQSYAKELYVKHPFDLLHSCGVITLLKSAPLSCAYTVSASDVRSVNESFFWVGSFQWIIWTGSLNRSHALDWTIRTRIGPSGSRVNNSGVYRGFDWWGE